MNQDNRRAFLLRLLVVTGAVFAARYTLVLPRVRQVGEMRQRFESQTRQAREGEKAIGAYSRQVGETVGNMSAVRDEMNQRLAPCESTQVHNRLQHAAEQNSLTVIRLEPMRSASAKGASGMVPDAAELRTDEFRIECTGPYQGIVAFLDELDSGPNLPRVTMFRMIPTSGDSARMVMQVSLHQLVKSPEDFNKVLTETTTRITQAGGEDGQS